MRLREILVVAAKAEGRAEVEETLREGLPNEYDNWVSLGLATFPGRSGGAGKKGRVKQAPATITCWAVCAISEPKSGDFSPIFVYRSTTTWRNA